MGRAPSPMATQPLLCCPAGLPSTASPLHPLGFHCSLQAPIPFPLNLRGAPQGGSDAHSSQHCPGLPLHPLKCCTHCWTPPVRPLPASCLVSRPFVPHQGLSRERPLSCREVLTAAPALALLCLSLGGHLLSWEGGKKLVTLARSCHVPCSFLWWLVGTGRWHRGWGLAPGAAPRVGDVP